MGKLMQSSSSIEILREVGVDAVALVDFADFFFQSDALGNSFDKTIAFNDFMEAVMKLRQGTVASVKDVMYLQKFVRDENMSMNSKLEELTSTVNWLKLQTVEDEMNS